MATDERRLVAAFRAGDRAAFDEVFQRFAPRVMAFTRRLTGSRAEAEDLTQETFLAALRGRGGFDGRSSLATWLFAIAYRRWRDSRRTPRLATVSSREDDAAGEGPEERIVGAIALRDAIDRLDPLLRDAFHLVVVQGLTHREAAVVLGRPVGTVKWCTATAARRLREALRDDACEDQEGVPAVHA